MTLLEDSIKWRLAVVRAQWAEWRARKPIKDRIMAVLAAATAPLDSWVIADRAKVFPALLSPFVLHDLALDGYVTFDVERTARRSGYVRPTERWARAGGKTTYLYSITRAGRERLLRVEPEKPRGIEMSEQEQEDFERAVQAGRGDR